MHAVILIPQLRVLEMFSQLLTQIYTEVCNNRHLFYFFKVYKIYCKIFEYKKVGQKINLRDL